MAHSLPPLGALPAFEAVARHSNITQAAKVRCRG
jgi:DNA-binding transcriptional LysR family regulator